MFLQTIRVIQLIQTMKRARVQLFEAAVELLTDPVDDGCQDNQNNAPKVDVADRMRQMVSELDAEIAQMDIDV